MKLFSHLPKCDMNSQQGMIYRVLISDLKPTQNAVGLDEIFEKRKKISKKKQSNKELADYLIQRTIPIIIGNGGFYMIDHHHLSYTLWEELGDMYVPVEIIKNWSMMEGYNFWKAMLKNHWLYPFAADGGGPLSPFELKKHIKDLGNDVFRSLSWIIRKKYGYVKSPQNAIFAEFKWGSFYRTRIFFKDQLRNSVKIEDILLTNIKDQDESDYMELINYAMYLATSNEAKALPGYRGN